ncbi:MAG: flavodoxin family protein [Candidatus Heimdallarchaeota archaeon]|nr:flavodoxin family protein [Candidatus Heimdallarchaeota archaeon]MBY8994211.1 flavodoxin family protein [Candidatus Heimdallarchaeota archaeon]
MSKIVLLLVLYHSQEYGNTKAMAEAVAAGAQTAGAEVTLINTNEKRFEIEEFRQFDAVVFGSPDYYSYIAGGLKIFVDDLYIARKTNQQGLADKPFGLFYSHGGGGRVREPFEKLFGMMRLGSKVGETIESYGSPNNQVLEECRKLGQQLVQVKKK